MQAGDRPLSDRQQEIIRYLNRTADDMTPAWLVARACGWGLGVAVANLRELRQRGLVVRQGPNGAQGLWGLRGPA